MSLSSRRAIQRRYYQRHRERLLVEASERRLERREELALYQREYRQNNKEKVAAAKRIYYQKNKDRAEASQRKRSQINRAYINGIKSQPCVDCGKVYPPCAMDFHHLRDKKNMVSRMIDRARLVDLQSEIEKCEVVCSNCHRIRHADKK